MGETNYISGVGASAPAGRLPSASIIRENSPLDAEPDRSAVRSGGPGDLVSAGLRDDEIVRVNGICSENKIEPLWLADNVKTILGALPDSEFTRDEKVFILMSALPLSRYYSAFYPGAKNPMMDPSDLARICSRLKEQGELGSLPELLSVFGQETRRGSSLGPSFDNKGGQTDAAYSYGLRVLLEIGFPVKDLKTMTPARLKYVYDSVNEIQVSGGMDAEQISVLLSAVWKNGGEHWDSIALFLPDLINEYGFDPEKTGDFSLRLSALIKGNNLTYDLGRYPYALMKEVLAARSDPEYKKGSPVAVIVLNQDDPNGAFRSPDAQYWKSIINAGFRIELFEASSDMELDARIEQVGGGKGRIDFLMIGGHGTPKKLLLGPGESEKAALDINDTDAVNAWKPHLADNVQILLDSCSNGQPFYRMNLAWELVIETKLRDAAVFAYPEPTNIEDIKFDGTKIDKVVLWHNQEALRFKAPRA